MTDFHTEVVNVGGVETFELSSSDSPIIISGPNSTNKTSLLKAIAFGLGIDDVPMRSGANEAVVTLELDNTSVTRTAERTGHGVTISGEGWVSNPEDKELLKHFATLLEFNPVRSAVRQNDDLEEILKSPIDFDELENRRSSKIGEKKRLKQNLESLKNVEKELDHCAEKIEEKREAVSKIEEELDELHDRQTSSGTADEEVSELRERRGDLVSSREDARRQLENTRDAIEALENQRAKLESELEQTTEEVEQYEIDDLKEKRSDIHAEVEEINTRIEILQSVLTANREMRRSNLTGILGKDRDLLGDTVQCWTCGTKVTSRKIEETLDSVQDLIKQDKQKRQQYRPEKKALDEKISQAESATQRMKTLQSEIQQLKEKIEDRKASLETTEQRLDGIHEKITQTDEQIEVYEDDHVAEVTDLTSEIETKRVELHSAQSELNRLKERRETLQNDKKQRDKLQTEIEQLTTEIRDLTQKIDGLETRLQSEFNEAMDELLGVLEFERIERIWLDGSFNLIIAREVDGHVQQDSLHHLSESEREMVGLVLALAGYMTYDLSEKVPVLLLDTLGAFDTRRTELLIEFFSEEVDYLAAAVRTEVGTQIESVPIESGELVALD